LYIITRSAILEAGFYLSTYATGSRNPCPLPFSLCAFSGRTAPRVCFTHASLFQELFASVPPRLSSFDFFPDRPPLKSVKSGAPVRVYRFHRSSCPYPISLAVSSYRFFLFSTLPLKMNTRAGDDLQCILLRNPHFGCLLYRIPPSDLGFTATSEFVAVYSIHVRIPIFPNPGNVFFKALTRSGPTWCPRKSPFNGAVHMPIPLRARNRPPLVPAACFSFPP